MTNNERIEDLLTEFDELDMQPLMIVPNPLDRAKAWKHELEYALKHLKAEVAREIFVEIEKILPSNLTVNGTFYRIYLKDAIAELKKKYIGEQTDDNTKRT